MAPGGRRRRPTGWLILIDAAAVAAAYGLALLTRFLGTPPAYNEHALLGALPLVVLAAVVLAQVYGLYEERQPPWPEQVQSLFLLAALNAVVAMAASFFVRSFGVPRSVIALAAVNTFLILYAYRRVLYRRWERVIGVPALVLLHVGPAAGVAAAAADTMPFKLVGDFNCEGLGAGAVVATAREVVREHRASGLLLDQTLPGQLKEDVALLALEGGLDLFVVPRLLDLLLLQSRPRAWDGRLVIEVAPSGRGYQQILKRFIDISLSVLFLTITLPVLLPALALVAAEDGWPVLYRQERVGRNGRRFTLIKIRTMVRDAEAATGPVLASAADPRATRVGRWLRQLHLDEVPQLWNVLRGEMSLVGPRPERPSLHDAAVARVPHFATRLHVLPGLTGLAQVQGDYHTLPQEKLKFDTLYALRSSAALDAQIILRTARTILAGLARLFHLRRRSS